MLSTRSRDDVRHTLLGAVVTDAARISRVGDDRGEQLLHQLLDDPLLSPALDDELIERLLARAQALVLADQPAACASLAASTLVLANRIASELIPDVRLARLGAAPRPLRVLMRARAVRAHWAARCG